LEQKISGEDVFKIQAYFSKRP